jgi:phosphoribosylamine--glycine ligase
MGVLPDADRVQRRCGPLSSVLLPTVDVRATARIPRRALCGPDAHAGRAQKNQLRFGDPECQPLMARLRGDLVEILWETAAGTLDTVEFDFDPRVGCCVVMCSAGYPGAFEKGKVITGIEDAQAMSDDVIVSWAPRVQ